MSVFDYLFVEDMQRIVEYFINNIPKHKIINITPTQSISLLEIAKLVKEISCSNCKIEIKNPVMNNEYTGDNSILLQEIPNFKFSPIYDGLSKLYSYIKQSSLEAV